MMVKYIVCVFIFLWSMQAVSAQVLWQGKQQNPDSLVYKGLNYVREDSLQQAVDLTRAVLARYPQYTDFNYILGLSYMKMGDYKVAEMHYKIVVDEVPDYYDAYYGLALALWTQGKHDEGDRIWTNLPDSIVNVEYVEQLRDDFLKATSVERTEIHKNFVLLEQGLVFYNQPSGIFFMNGLTYGRKVLPSISISAQLNWAKLRNGDGLQYLLESWTNYSKSLYAYNSVGFSDSFVFPRWRVAYSLYKEHQSWQYDIGLRYMYPQIGLDNLTGVLSVGKYLGANFFYARSFITYNQERTEAAFSASWRYYYKESKPETFFTVIGNIGTSPDDPERYLFYNNPAVFKSYALTAGLQHRIGKYVLGSNGAWSAFKINDLDYLYQYNLNFSVKRYF